MKEYKHNGKIYKLPEGLTDFQTKLYTHLIDWKWKNITREVGVYTKKVKGTTTKQYEYDAIIPESVHHAFPLIYPSILPELLEHQKQYYFKFHQHFNHMASSQAANANLFLPILLNPKVNKILNQLKPDFNRLATEYLYKGFRIEFWDGNSNDEKGLLGDHSAIAGTDSDIAIAYYNNANELCLWLIEHKLTEREFTECGGAKSKNRDDVKHDCSRSFSEILKNKNYCYYHEYRKFEYWNITEKNQSFFPKHTQYSHCPFIGGMNQLWRNQLLGFAIEKEGTYKNTYFSVVKHPDNPDLDKSIDEYKKLINDNPRFFDFSSKNVVDVVMGINDKELNKWVKWYSELYDIK